MQRTIKENVKQPIRVPTSFATCWSTWLNVPPYILQLGFQPFVTTVKKNYLYVKLKVKLFIFVFICQAKNKLLRITFKISLGINFI